MLRFEFPCLYGNTCTECHARSLIDTERLCHCFRHSEHVIDAQTVDFLFRAGARLTVLFVGRIPSQLIERPADLLQQLCIPLIESQRITHNVVQVHPMATVDDDIRYRDDRKSFQEFLGEFTPESLKEHLKLIDSDTIKVNSKGVEVSGVLVCR